MKNTVKVALGILLLSSSVIAPMHADARGGGGGRSGGFSSSSRSSSSFSFGSKSSSSSFSNPFRSSGSSSSSSSSRSTSSIWGKSSVSDSGRDAYRTITNKSPTPAPTPPAPVTASAPSAPSPRKDYNIGGYGTYSAPSRPTIRDDHRYVAQAPAPVAAPVPATNTVIVHDHDSGFFNGMIMGSLLSNHDHEHYDDDRDRRSYNNTPASSQSAGNVTQQANPMVASAPTSDAPTKSEGTACANNEIGNVAKNSQGGALVCVLNDKHNPVWSLASVSVPQSQAPASAPYSAGNNSVVNDKHKSGSGLAWFIVIVMLGGGVVLVLLMRKKAKSDPTSFSGLAQNVVRNAKDSFSSNDDDDDSVTIRGNNPFNVKFGKLNSMLVIADVLKFRSYAGNFPALDTSNFSVSAYGVITLNGRNEFSGLSIERIYLGDGSLFLQTTFKDGRPIENVLYNTIINENLDGTQVHAVLEGGDDNIPQMGTKTQTFKTNDGKSLVYDRIIGGSDDISYIRGHETVTTSDGSVLKREVNFAFYSNNVGGNEEFIMPMLTFSEEDGTNYVASVGIKVEGNQVSVIQ